MNDEWDGSPPAKVFQFLRKFAKACDDNNLSEGEAFYILQDFTKEPLKAEVMMVLPTRRAVNPGKVTSYLELINWMIRRHVDEASVATLVETLNVAVQRDDVDELSFAERLRRLNTKCGFMYGEGAFKKRFVEGVHHAARATVHEQNIPGMTMAELARVAQTRGDEHRWLRLEQHKERTEEREALAEEARLWRKARAAALTWVTGGTRGYKPRDAPVWTVGAVGAPTPGARYCDNTLSPPHPVGGRASQTVSPGSPVGEYPPRKETPKSTHARRRPGEGAPSDKHELCDRKFTCPRRRPRGDTHASPSYPIRSPRTLGKFSSDALKGPSENPPQTPSKDPRKFLLRHPQRTHGKPSLRAHWAHNPEDGRSFEYRLE